MAIYMQIPGIKGDATQGKHTDWIILNSCQWGVGRGISTPVGGANNREASEPSVSEVTVTKDYDSSSVLLFQESTVGMDAKTPIKLDFCRTDQEGEPYLQIELSDVLISGYSFSSGGDRPNESLSLNFTKIAVNETGPNQKNGAGQPVKAQYDIAKASK
jgi:type VI secretion system secreted protein Hcp